MKLFGEVNNLAGVIAKMLYDMKDGVQDGLWEALRLDHALQRRLGGFSHKLCGQSMQHRFGFSHGCVEVSQQSLLVELAVRRKFRRPRPHVQCAADAGNQPLPRVARQMQQQIADAVAGGIGPPPKRR
jgi:hypothetical protein